MAIDASKWTSDWAIGREIFTAYQDSRKKDLAILCFGDPEKPSGFLVEPVGEALAEYHPHVFGTLEAPLHTGNLAQRWAEHGQQWANSFLIVIAPKAGPEEAIGYVVPSRAPLALPDLPAGVPPLGDVVLYATVFLEGMEELGVPANPHLERRSHRAAHMIVDGVLRFFHKIQYDHILYRRPGRRVRQP
ncbi:MAG: DUF1256 domain-containing protein [Limnochordales bacterium]